MVDLAPVLGLAAALELHRCKVRPGDDEVALDHPHGERGHFSLSVARRVRGIFSKLLAEASISVEAKQPPPLPLFRP
jgi:hypothetical protein